jgi:hypothetical protein
MSRFVFDTNTIVSAAILLRSTPAKALTYAQSAGVLLVSDTVVAEYVEVIRRPKLDF